MTNNIECILEKVEALTEVERKPFLLEAIKDIKQKHQKNNLPAAQLSHTLGYLWFRSIELNASASELAKNHFFAAINSDYQSHFSRYYLGVLLFGEKRYEEALSILNVIPDDFLKDLHDQHWRDLNVRAYIASGKAMLGSWVLAELQDICRCFQNDKNMDLDMPDDLILSCIIANTIHPGEQSKMFAGYVIDMINNNSEYSKWYSSDLIQLNDLQNWE